MFNFSDGAKLNNVIQTINMYVSGILNKDDVTAMSLTLMMPKQSLLNDVSFKCEIAYMNKDGASKVLDVETHVSKSDVNKAVVKPTASNSEYSISYSHRLVFYCSK